ncbi:MAG TPA: tripartite tricarboxylate transporter substrate-binding protein [Acetobacteraceae bacterium]|nr:tripartite tricarboxylate transporter substrate-binding protein [Acetobacteraceae bacterium]
MNNGPRRRDLLALAGVGLALPALAQPSMTLRLIVGAPRGTGTDRWARGFAPFLERHWPRSSVSLVSQPGEGGLAAARSLLAAPPDGQTIGLASVPSLIARIVERGETDLLDRLVFVAAVTEEPVVLVAPPGTDFAALRLYGGRGFMGCPPPGSAGQLVAVELANTLPLTPLSFPNATAARQAVLAGNLAAALLLLPDVLSALREERLVALAAGPTERSPLLPEVPSFAERGLPAPFYARRGCMLPHGVPADLQAKLERSLRAVVTDPEFVAQGAETGFRPRFIAGESWTAELRTIAQRLNARWSRTPWIVLRD